MTITILNVRRAQIRPDEAIFGLVADVEITDGVDTYATAVGGIPDGLTRSQVQMVLDNRFDEVWAVATAKGAPLTSANVLDNPNLDMRRVAIALALVLRDRDEHIINSINALADFLGVPQVNRPEPVTPQQVYNAVRAKYIELGQG